MDAAREAIQAAAGRPAPGESSRRRAAEPLGLEPALSRLWDELRGLLHDQLLLLSLESRQTVAGLMRMLILAIVCAALLLGAWAAAMAALLMWLAEIGLSVALALGLVTGTTLLLAAALFWLTRRSLREVTFPATLRRLANDPPPSLE